MLLNILLKVQQQLLFVLQYGCRHKEMQLQAPTILPQSAHQTAASVQPTAHQDAVVSPCRKLNPGKLVVLVTTLSELPSLHTAASVRCFAFTRKHGLTYMQLLNQIHEHSTQILIDYTPLQHVSALKPFSKRFLQHHFLFGTKGLTFFSRRRIRIT